MASPFFFENSFRAPQPSAINLGNFADQLTALAIGEQALPPRSPFNLGDYASQLSAGEGSGGGGDWLEYVGKGLGGAAQAAAAAALGKGGKKAAQRTYFSKELPKRFSLSEYLAALAMDPGRARL